MSRLTYRLELMEHVWPLPYTTPPWSEVVLIWTSVCLLCAVAWDLIEHSSQICSTRP